MLLKNKILTLLTIAALSLMIVSCGKKDEVKEARLVYVNWAGTIAMTNLVSAVLQNKMGYKVKMTSADVGPVYASLASGDQDAFMGSWLPVTHESYLEEYGDKVIDLGYNFEGAKIGLVVPAYVDATTISDLNNVKNEIKGEIIGIDSGAGIMKATEKAIPAYELDLKLIPSSGPAMTAALKTAIDANESIVVTGWKPHWKFARFDLKFLEDPQGIYGDVENIHTIAKKALPEEKPELAQFLKNFKLDNDQLSSLMDKIEKSSGDPYDAAVEWMNENSSVVESWIPKK